ncbi:MAG: hypothetical protein K5650_02445 [Bacteroidales bacterium]|nr:hypothetical protein [Bacteroidales bacterium]
MKKVFLAVACAFMVAFGMTSCDPEEFQGIADDIVKDLDNSFGSVALKVSDPNGVSPFATKDSVLFSACVTGIVTDTTNMGDLTDSLEGYEGFTGNNTFIMGANISLADSSIDLTNVYPIFGLKTNDTADGIHIISDPMKDTNMLMDFNFGKLITKGSTENLFGIAMSDVSWYVGASGEFDIKSYPDPGLLMKAELRNVKAYYITQTQLDSVDRILNRIKAAAPYETQYGYLLEMDSVARNIALAGMSPEERNAFEAALDVIEDAAAAKDVLDSIVENPSIFFASIVLNGKLEARRTDVQGFVEQLSVE